MEKKNIFIEIIYNGINSKDSEEFYNNISPNNHINYITQNNEKFFYFEEIKNFSNIKKYLNKNEIPENYSEYFGENVSFYYEYKKKGIKFEEYIELKKVEIKKEILEINKYFLREIYDKIKKKEKFLYNEILKYIPFNYIIVIIEPKPIENNFGYDSNNDKNPKYYSLCYAFPLVQEVIEESIKSPNFIDMKNDSFLDLPPSTLGNNFDYEMIKKFENMLNNKNNKFFGEGEKIQIFVENILEKLGKGKSQIYKKEEVIKKINEISEYKEKIKEFKKINFNDYHCIGVFQREYSGKAFDLLFFFKLDSTNQFIMNLLQIKCSDTFKENNNLIYQIAYVKEKFSYLLNISISSMYYCYLSIYQKPKLFAFSHKEKTFLYDLKKEIFVDFDGKEYGEFPIMEGAVIHEVEETEIINKLINDLIEYNSESIDLKEKKIDFTKFENKNKEKIKNCLKIGEVYIFASEKEYRYYYKHDDSNFYYLEIEKNGKNIYNGIFEKCFKVIKRK